jgi:hypothetical protein
MNLKMDLRYQSEMEYQTLVSMDAQSNVQWHIV